MDDYDDTFGYLANNNFHISFTYLTLYEIVFNKTIGNKLNRIKIPDTYHQIGPLSSETLSEIERAVLHCCLHGTMTQRTK